MWYRARSKRRTSEYLCQVERVARAIASELEGTDDFFEVYEGCAASVIETMYAHGTLVAVTPERLAALQGATRQTTRPSAKDNDILMAMIEEVRLSGHEYRFGDDESVDGSKAG